MTTTISGSGPSVTFSDGTTQSTAGLPLTGGTVTGPIVASTVGSGSGSSLSLQSNGVTNATLDTSGNLLVGHTSGGSTSNPGVIKAQGYNTQSGFGGTIGTNVFNIQWTGSPYLWIDTTNVGQIAFTSDYRIKQNIITNTTPALSRIAQLRPVTYEYTNYKNLFVADGVTREGFIAHELQAVIPSAIDGVKDDPNQIQSLKLDALCSVMVKAIQEQQVLITDLQTKLKAAGITGF
jgi:hypothetical protein